jgi:hypothetical protein
MDADAFLDQMEDLLDQGRMPVYVALDGDMVYAISYEIADWSPLLTGTPDVRTRLVTEAIVATAYEAKNKKGLPVVDS